MIKEQLSFKYKGCGFKDGKVVNVKVITQEGFYVQLLSGDDSG